MLVGATASEINTGVECTDAVPRWRNTLGLGVSTRSKNCLGVTAYCGRRHEAGARTWYPRSHCWGILYRNPLMLFGQAPEFLG